VQLMGAYTSFSDILSWVRTQSKKNNTNYETAILFSEIAISPGSRPERHINMIDIYAKLFSRTLLHMPEISVAFCVFENNNGVVSSTGYLITREAILWRPKLAITNYENDMLVRYALNINQNNVTAIIREMKDKTIVQSKNLIDENPDFRQTTTPSGRIVEYRICADIFRQKSRTEPEILLVSAAGLNTSSQELNRFKTVLVHDGLNGVSARGEAYHLISIQEESTFWVATLLDE